MELQAKDKERLQRAVDGRNSSQGFVHGTKQEFKTLADAGLVEFNDAVKDGNKVATRATDAGVAALNGAGATNGAAAATAPQFKITKGISLPAVRRRVGEATGSKYPFDTLEVGDSFHVPKSEKLENPAKSLASSVTAANRRFAEKLEGTHTTKKGNTIPNYKYTKEFTIRAVDKSDPEGVGARIWRTK